MNALKWLRTNFKASRRCLSLNTHIPEKGKENTLSNKNLLPYTYIMKATSNKHLLTHLPASCNFWLKIPQDKLDAVTEVMNYVLQAIILYDDVQDGTHYRRNLPAANRVYGTPLSLSSSIFCILQGFNKVLSLENPKALNVYCDNFLKCMRGTAQDIYWRDNFLCPTEDEYKAISADKIGSYFLTTSDLMQLFSQDQRDYRELMITLGLYYQIRDEYTNLVKVEALEEKSRHQEFKDLHNLMQCEDITEGRFSWTMIHALKTSEGPTIRSILVQRTTDIKIKQYCLSLLEKVGSLDYTRQTLHDLDVNLRDQALNVYCDNFLKMVRGTAQDIYWRDNFICPTEDEYKAMNADKSGSYFLMTFGLMQSFSQDQRDYWKLMMILGFYYQIRDEYTNLVKVEALEEKSRYQEFKDLHNLMQCEDITEGRFSWAMIHALKSSEGPTIRSILVQRTTDSKIKQYCVSLLEKIGSLDYTRQTLKHLDTDLRDQIRRLGGNPKLIALLDQLYNWNG